MSTPSTKGGLDVNIMGREFRIACREEEQHELHEADELIALAPFVIATSASQQTPYDALERP